MNDPARTETFCSLPSPLRNVCCPHAISCFSWIRRLLCHVAPLISRTSSNAHYRSGRGRRKRRFRIRQGRNVRFDLLDNALCLIRMPFAEFI